MSKSQYRSTNFRGASRKRINQAVEILGEYDQRLTVRQLYYQFVARGFIDNTPRMYQNIASLITDARYAGLIDWNDIEDRGREPDEPGEWDSIEDIVNAAVRGFRLPRWAGQRYHVELWVEKQALAGVLSPIAKAHHVTLMVNKGYSSASAMKTSADRISEACKLNVVIGCASCEDHDAEEDDGDCSTCGEKWEPKAFSFAAEDDDLVRTPIVLYLGDHDPSGEDMVRDIGDRLREFGVDAKVEKLALTMTQIRQFDPPPNPAKLTDSRAADYIARHGDQSWELDALPPRELTRIANSAIERYCDRGKMNEVIAEENGQRKRLEVALVAMNKAKKKAGK